MNASEWDSSAILLCSHQKGLRRKLHKNIRLEGIVVHDLRNKRVQKEHKNSFNT